MIGTVSVRHPPVPSNQGSILARAYVMPDFSKHEGKAFHGSAFKWSRVETDTTGFIDGQESDDDNVCMVDREEACLVRMFEVTTLKF